MLIMGLALASCQQAGLTEDEVRNIVQEEVTRQLVSLDSLVKQEVTGQLTNIDDIIGEEITSQFAGLDDIVTREVTKQLANVGDVVRQEISSEMAGVHNIVADEVIRTVDNIDLLTVSELWITSRDGNTSAILGADPNGRGMLALYDAETMRYIARLGANSAGDGAIGIMDRYGEWNFVAP